MKPQQLLLSLLLSVPALGLAAGAGAPGKVAHPSRSQGETGQPSLSGSGASLEVGQKLYLEGIRENGSPLEGNRPNGTKITGKQAACVMCHRRSGLGGVEGQSVIPPISGRALFGGGEPVLVQEDRRFNTGLSSQHAPYDDKSFAQAIRQGKDYSGRKMEDLMARYDLTNSELKALSAYLRTLSVTNSPGVDGRLIQLATVITPEVSQERRKAFLDTLQPLLKQFNMAVGSRQNQHVPVLQRTLKTRRLWALQVWELTGPRDTWKAQLEQRQREKPVFAVMSGLGQGEWQPVQDFCEENRVACWFPSLDVAPVNAEKDFYGVYFSRGTTLEADVIGHRLAAQKARGVVQIAGADAAAQAAKAALHRSLEGKGSEILDLNWDAQHPEAVKAALEGLHDGDALVLWLRPQELKALASMPVPKGSVYFSTFLNGGEHVELPEAWLKSAWLADGFEKPDLRQANLGRLHGWLKFREVPQADDKMQSEVFFAVNSFSWMMAEMLNNLHTDYLIERAEATLSMREAMQVQEEINAQMMGGGGRGARPDQNGVSAMPGHPAVKPVDLDQMLKRQGTTVYPRLSLGLDQRYASKGAYLVPLGSKDSAPEWIVPQ